MKRLMSIGVILVASLVAAACGSSSSGSGSGGNAKGPSGVLTISNESGALWTCNFNPYNLSDVWLSLGPTYEPLMFVSSLQNGKITPWLATADAWSNGNKTL